MERGTPRAGDVVVRREAGNPHDHYTVLVFPGFAQVSYKSFETALKVATRFARHAGLNVWHEEEDRFTLIEARVAANPA